MPRNKKGKKKQQPARPRAQQGPAMKVLTVNQQRTRTLQPRLPQPPKNMAAMLQVCSITDPFCKAAWGAKFPGTTSSKTMPYPFHARFVLTTDAGGSASTLLLPSFTKFCASASVITAGVGTYSAFDALPAVTFTPKAFRIVSWGVRVKCTQSSQNNAGMLRIRGLAAPTGATLGSIDNLTYNCDFSEDLPLSSVADVCIVGRKQDTQFDTLSTNVTPANVAAWTTNGWGPVLLSLTGSVASTTPVDCELFVNYEVQFDDADTMALAMTPALPANTMVTQVSSTISSIGQNVFSRGVASVEKFVQRAAVAGLSAAAARYGGPQAGLATMSALAIELD